MVMSWMDNIEGFQQDYESTHDENNLGLATNLPQVSPSDQGWLENHHFRSNAELEQGEMTLLFRLEHVVGTELQLH